ncbi:MAG TPA: bifunctional DNA-formamidopyrimidine glycosylase/DNA-(apurinic or apyrimidinic site) lyase [Candidatus Saccharimonadales bacterium]|nr:bifunctional DNA-formamidopyrimidine glycosylase/DNA-(apurinic or apyrimidinic site) lyase [Candidatus Saccharimonadales bacterium]
MPELPEVETIRIGLSTLLPQRRITDVTSTNWGKSLMATRSDVAVFAKGARVVGIRRRAKVLLIDLSSKYSFIIHLKMTGQLVFRAMSGEHFGAGHPSDSLVGALPDSTTRVIISFEDATLFFNDQRKFGWVRLMPTVEVEHLDFFQKVGPEPLAADFTADDFAKRLLRRTNSGVKAVLLDQTVIAGIGNIYADESLWGAKIHPETKVRDLSSAQLKKLYESLRAVLKLSIKKGGSTDRNYVNHEGKRGSYLSFANVFRREGQPCPRCGTTILKLRAAGRGTHICPHCQRRS